MIRNFSIQIFTTFTCHGIQKVQQSRSSERRCTYYYCCCGATLQISFRVMSFQKFQISNFKFRKYCVCPHALCDSSSDPGFQYVLPDRWSRVMGNITLHRDKVNVARLCCNTYSFEMLAGSCRLWPDHFFTISDWGVPSIDNFRRYPAQAL